jgi:hypothetical protein
MTFILLLIASLAGQTISITGTVSNSSGQPLSGVLVQLMASGVKDTTGADGNYVLTTGSTGVRPAMNETVLNSIRYRDNRFFFRASSPLSVSVRLFSMDGKLVANVYDGRIGRGVTEIPFSRNRFGHNASLLNVRTSGTDAVYKLFPGPARTFLISGMSPDPAGAGLAKAAAAEWLQATKLGYTSHTEQITAASATINITMSSGGAAPNFGPNTYVFDPSMSNIQNQLTSIYNQLQGAQFGSGRCAFLFKPGRYNVSILLGFYTEVLGLGLTPDSVQITGVVESDAYLGGGNATCNFWRSCAGLAVTPTGGTDLWAVSQACPMRRMHFKGNLNIAPNPGAGSGGFIADSRVEGTIGGWQEQWFSRNSQYNGWSSGGWNFVFVGNANPPSGTWPNPPYTVVPKTPIIREKPFLFVDNTGSYGVMVPALRKDSTLGITWTSGTTPGTAVPIDLFYIARSTDNAASINAALASGKNLLLTPGIYNLEASIKVTRPGTIVLGIGMPSLVPQNGTPALEAADVDGLKIGGFIVDASGTNSANLMVIGEPGSVKDHSSDPTSMWDIFCRVGGEFSGTASCMLTINSGNVILDHAWLWRADHGTGAGWTSNRNANGLIVNGANVTAYGLFVEHTQEYQVMWNGNGGRSYFLQCELPYDVPNQTSWMAGSVNGYAAYKVGSSVTSHEGWALGAYAFFNRAPVVLANAIEVPANVSGIKMRNLLTVTLSGNQGTVSHIINGAGSAVTPSSGQVMRLQAYP